jgi:3-hydroxybutyryl-CoA dehydrogenase
MGSQIACEYAIAGHDVVVVARRREVAGERIAAGLASARKHGLASSDRLAAAHERISYVDDADEASDANIIVESVVEDLAAKRDALRPAAAANPGAIIATNTSSIPISVIGSAIGAGERTIGAHYWNPPLLMPMVEVIRGVETADAVEETMTATLRSLGKRPVIVDRDVPGFAWNRLQLALLREAVWLVENGVASPETVDEIVRDGLARRWRYTGPFQTAALGGAATFERVATLLWPELSQATAIHELKRWLDESPETTEPLRDRRDRGLAADMRMPRPMQKVRRDRAPAKCVAHQAGAGRRRSGAALGGFSPFGGHRAGRPDAFGTATGGGVRRRPLDRAGGDRRADAHWPDRGEAWRWDIPQASRLAASAAGGGVGAAPGRTTHDRSG